MNLEIHYSDDWAALYVDGKLDCVGDSYIAEERALTMLGVVLITDDAFMRGQRYRDGVAGTLEEVEEFRSQRATALDKAEALRDEAARLLAEAENLEGAVTK